MISVLFNLTMLSPLISQVLKLYAWEESFMNEIKQIRYKELKSLRNSGLWASGFNFTFGCAPVLVSDIR